MSAAARLAVELGHEVRGSDNPLYPPASHMVASLGVPVASSYDESNLDWKPDVVVVGNALSRGNVEIEAILERRLVFKSMPEWIKEEVLRFRQPVVICGTHGKTTTTTLTAYLLDRAGLQPGFLIGGQPLDFPHAARLGKESAPFVIEGDEYDTAFFDKRAKFFHYLPQIAVVTSLEFDHGDIYPNVEAIEQAFRLMLRQIPRNGRLILCAEAPRALALASHAFCPVVTYGFQTGVDYQGQWENPKTQGTRLRVTKKGKDYGVFELPLWGNHNALNVLAALAVADQYAIEVSALEGALRDFKGVRRRMEVFLQARGAVFIDDFAHHPTAIRETVAAARLRFPTGRLRVLCEPRSNTMVTNRFQNDLIDALSGADEVWLGAVYRAESIPPETRLDRETVRIALENRGVAANVGNTAEEIARAVWDTLQAGDVVLILSNGAFGGIYESFRKMANK